MAMTWQQLMSLLVLTLVLTRTAWLLVRPRHQRAAHARVR
jgi:hypothetical protein